jgi:hypothetical protein
MLIPIDFTSEEYACPVKPGNKITGLKCRVFLTKQAVEPVFRRPSAHSPGKFLKTVKNTDGFTA